MVIEIQILGQVQTERYFLDHKDPRNQDHGEGRKQMCSDDHAVSSLYQTWEKLFSFNYLTMQSKIIPKCFPAPTFENIFVTEEMLFCGNYTQIFHNWYNFQWYWIAKINTFLLSCLPFWLITRCLKNPLLPRRPPPCTESYKPGDMSTPYVTAIHTHLPH